MKTSPLLFIVFSCAVLFLCLTGCSSPVQYDVIIRGGKIYDGGGNTPFNGDIAIDGDRIAALGDLGKAKGTIEVDASGLAIAPGFINVLSWATDSLIQDGRSQSDIRQGVTLEIFGEGWSYGPFSDSLKQLLQKNREEDDPDITWTTLGEYLEFLVKRGISPNIASFVGATTLRMNEIGQEDRPPTPPEMERMRQMVKQAMEEGALGIGSALIYAPAFYAETNELIELCKVAAQYGGTYISHMRSEGDRLMEGLEELLTIAREAGIAAQIYHLKAAGKANWHKLDLLIKKVEEARASGLKISADMYTYTAGATGLDAAMPPWVREGGREAFVKRLKNPKIRKKIIAQMKAPGDNWENLLAAAGSADRVLLVAFKNEKLQPLTGKTLAQVAAMRNASPEETAIQLMLEDDSRVGAVYFLMSEENVRKKIALPWVSFDSDEASYAPEGKFLKSNPHPRAYGNFARLLGKYVREEKIISLEEAVRKLTSLPAGTFKIKQRGRLKKGYYADIAIFDPATIRDKATYEKPHQYAVGMKHVFVNGVHTFKDGQHTGAKAGRVVRGPGYRGKSAK